MKKAVVTILLVLPFVLMIIISFAAKIVSNYQYINVESICIAKDERNCYKDEVIKMGKDANYDLNIRIYPEFANNKEVIFTSSNEEVIKVDDHGVVNGVNYGIAYVRVTSKENRDIYSIMNFEVKDDQVSSVELDVEEITLTIKQSYALIASVYPETAIKDVTYTSSDPSIASVDSNGRVTGVKAGEAIITATSADGQKSDTCKVIVENRIDFGFVDYDGVYLLDSNEVDLNTLIIYNSELIDLEDIVYDVKFGDYVSQNGNQLVLLDGPIVRVEARVNGTDYVADIYLRYKSN